MSNKKTAKQDKKQAIDVWEAEGVADVDIGIKLNVTTDYFLFNDSEREICVDGVGILPPGKNVLIPSKVLDRILADEAGLKKINVSVVG